MITNAPMPTVAAMRAADALSRCLLQPWLPADIEAAARIFDRETGLPKLIAACRQWIALRARCNALGPGLGSVGWSRIDREIEDRIAAQIEAMIAEKARGK